METNPVSKGIISENFSGVGAVTRGMVHQRAKELAMISGRSASQVSQSDYEQAKRELTGESDMDRQDEILESLPEAKRWDPVPGSTGREDQVPPSDYEYEDEEGRNESAQLVEEGVQEAEHDLMVKAQESARESERRDSRGY
jgi:hypothetical protein